MRTFVVDDSVVYRRAISEALAAVPGVEVVGTAATGRLALSRLAALKPDLMTLDIEMPDMDGLAVLQEMKTAGLGTGVIVLSAQTERGGELTIRALELGAFDFLAKPSDGTPEANIQKMRERLEPMLRAWERRREHHAPAPAPLPVLTRPLAKTSPFVLIGVSTGGPQALATVLPALPFHFGVPVFVVQHMPPMFTQPLAESLSAKCALPVREAIHGETAKTGTIYLAPGGKQMKLERGPHGEAVIRITDDPPEHNCRPAVDYLFRSVALNFPGRSIAVILTGMGCDGTAGLRMLKRGGCASIAQDQASSVVFGMPRESDPVPAPWTWSRR